MGTGATSAFYASVPLYTRSLTWTLEEQPLTGAGGATENAPFSVLKSPSPPIAVTPVFNAGNTMITGISIGAFTVHFYSSGRNLTLRVRAWSNGDGTGALLASANVLNIAPATATVPDFALASNISAFVITPPNPTITLHDPGSNSLNTAKLTVSLVLSQLPSGVGDQTLAIDPRALSVTSTVTHVTLVPQQTGSSPAVYSYLATATNVGTDTITVRDSHDPAHLITGTTTLTVVGTAGAGLSIN